jgi:predicted nucleic acid-binding protein
MAFTVIYDACVLYPAPLRDLLVRLATTGLFRAKWTDAILDECFDAILKDRDDLTRKRLDRTRQLMNAAVRDCLVEGYDDLIDGLSLPDPDDRHVLAAAVRCDAQVIVTWNVSDFPATALARYNIESQDPDEFVLNVIDLGPAAVVRVVHQQAGALKQPAQTVEELLDTLERQGLAQSVAMLRGM